MHIDRLEKTVALKAGFSADEEMMRGISNIVNKLNGIVLVWDSVRIYYIIESKFDLKLFY